MLGVAKRKKGAVLPVRRLLLRHNSEMQTERGTKDSGGCQALHSMGLDLRLQTRQPRYLQVEPLLPIAMKALLLRRRLAALSAPQRPPERQQLPGASAQRRAAAPAP